MLYISRLVFSEYLMRVFYSLSFLLAKDHFFDPIHFARAKQLCVGLFCFLFLYFFLISTALSHAPLCNRDPCQVG